MVAWLWGLLESGAAELTLRAAEIDFADMVSGTQLLLLLLTRPFVTAARI
ncbi:MAG: hypothetical protein NTV94_00220 [Planctomycetota bacterium]|nr:hypothetical protein [Planctomycetota bacterium]